MNEAWTKKGSSPFCSSHVGERLHQEGGLRMLGREPGRGPRRAVPVGPGEARDRAVEVVGIGRHVDPLGRQPPPPLAAARLPGLVDHRPEAGEHPLVASGGGGRPAGRVRGSRLVSV